MKLKKLAAISVLSILSFSATSNVSDEKSREPAPNQYLIDDMSKDVFDGEDINSNSDEYLDAKFKQIDESIYKSDVAEQHICQPWPRC